MEQMIKSLVNERCALSDQIRFLERRKEELSASIRKSMPHICTALEKSIAGYLVHDWSIANLEGTLSVCIKLKDCEEDLYEELALPLDIASKDKAGDAIRWWLANSHLLQRYNCGFALQCLETRQSLYGS